ncbi:MAG TPA: glycogen synthase GlgA [Verrucomicrobiae bacterium]
MKILLASSEVHPFSKTGGLADMVGALAKTLARLGHQVGLVTPLYRGIAEKHKGLQPFDWKLEIPLGDHVVSGGVQVLQPEPNLTIYFIDQPEFYQRSGLYLEGGHDYADNDQRFIFFSKAVVNLALYLPWQPEIVHIHDWQVGLVPLLLQTEAAKAGKGKPPASCLTIHNLAYQGVFGASSFWLTNAPFAYFNADGAEFWGSLNCLKAAIAFSDYITTVSPRYAREITTEEFGCGLDGLLRSRQDRLVGILNGVDYDEWNTTNNPCLVSQFSAEDLAAKTANKLALQEQLGLPVRADVPMFGTVSRLADQKGMDIQLGALEEMLAADMQFVLLGSGSAQMENAFRDLAKRHAGKVGIKIGYDHVLAHRIEAACDFFLMPSKFEPCGLNQMYSLRYGTIPVVRAVGGLDDSVIDATESGDEANGIKLHEYSVRALAKAIRKALILYKDPEVLTHFRQNGMNANFSWDRTAEEYVAVYQAAMKG